MILGITIALALGACAKAPDAYICMPGGSEDKVDALICYRSTWDPATGRATVDVPITGDRQGE